MAFLCPQKPNIPFLPVSLSPPHKMSVAAKSVYHPSVVRRMTREISEFEDISYADVFRSASISKDGMTVTVKMDDNSVWKLTFPTDYPFRSPIVTRNGSKPFTANDCWHPALSAAKWLLTLYAIRDADGLDPRKL